MRLQKINIRSFKSVINQTIEITDKCMGLVGLNESGKTNVLCAIRMLDGDYGPKLKDRSKIDDLLPCVEYMFDFKGCSDSHDSLVDDMFNERHVAGWADAIDPSTLNIKEISVVKEMNNSGKLEFSYSSLFDCGLESISQYMISSDDVDIPVDTTIQINGKTYKYAPGLIIESSKIPEDVREFFIDLTEEHIARSINTDIGRILEAYDHLPSVVYWEYSSEYLIPSEISYAELTVGNSPEKVSRPLYNIFLISKDLKINNSEDLLKRIELWKNDSSRRKKDASIINESVNKYMKNVWEDYDQEFDLALEAEGVTIHIIDPKSPNKNYYEMVERSQGFKTFASFLLTIAAENHVGELSNFILVLDEPETHLHPSGVNFMKKELLTLSEKKNNVFYATHSIFMIDRVNLERHLIVEKHSEKTILRKIDRNSLINENVIFEALGTNIDEFSMKLDNVLFEGIFDRNIFRFYLDNCLPKSENPFLRSGLLDGCGTNQIDKYFKSRILPEESTWRIILDNDKPAKTLEKNLNKYFGSKIGKSILISNYSENEDYILEDLFPVEVIQSAFDKLLESDYPDFKAIKYNHGLPVRNVFDEFMSLNSIGHENSKAIFIELKELVEGLVNEILKNIKKQKKIEDRNTLFSNDLPDYYAFISSYLALTPPPQ